MQKETKEFRNHLPLKATVAKNDSSDTDEEGDDGELMSSIHSSSQPYNEGTTSATEWIGITTNSEECSYSSADIDQSDSQIEYSENGGAEYDFSANFILNPSCGIGDRSE